MRLNIQKFSFEEEFQVNKEIMKTKTNLYDFRGNIFRRLKITPNIIIIYFVTSSILCVACSDFGS